MSNKYSLRKQVNNRGFYCEIIFDCVVSNSFQRSAKLNYTADPRWETSCKAGVQIFHDYFIRKQNSSLEVTIHEIKWNPVDTNDLIILFSIVQALSEALDFPLPGFQLDLTNERFIFPEARNFNLSL